MADDTADELLLLAVAGGEGEAFNEFYERFSRPLYSLGLRWLQDPGDAEEMVSDTLIRAWQQAGRFDAGRGAVSSWLFGIARHVASDRWRARTRQVAESLDGGAEPRHEAEADSICDAFDLALAMGHLTPILREVLVLTYARDQTEAEIALQLGIPCGTVKSRRFNALRALATKLGEPRAEARPIAVREA